MIKILLAPRGKRLLLVWSSVVLGVLVSVGVYLGARGTQASKPPAPEYPAWESKRLFTFPGDWTRAPETVVRAIYPAQASWEWVTSPAHPGGASVNAGTPCAACHGNPVVGAPSVAGWAGPPADHKRGFGCQACHGVLQQRVEGLGEGLVGPGPLENDPIEGKRPYVDVKVRAAYDREYLYLRFEWASARPGILHDLWRWDGQKWVAWGGPKPDAPKAGQTPSYEDRLTVIAAEADIPAQDGAKVGYSQAGCWITCHSSMRMMPKEPTTEQVRADPFLGDKGLKKTEVQKYLLITRREVDEAGGWNKGKSAAEIQRLLQDKQFLDMLMWRAARSGPIGYADDFYVLEYRNADKGKSMFTENALKDGRPSFIYNEAKVGFKAIPEGRLEELLGKSPLIEQETASPFDPSASFQVGDIVSRRLLRTPDGSRADILANSRWADGKWILEMRRKLNTGNPDDVVFEPGRVYTIGIAVFEDMVSNRRHHVSFPVTLGIGVPANIVAVPIATP